jgi:hypothetical protein
MELLSPDPLSVIDKKGYIAGTADIGFFSLLHKWL